MMPTLPTELLPLIVEFQPRFSKPVWKNALPLLLGAVLATGKRTVTACLLIIGKSGAKNFQNYHPGSTIPANTAIISDNEPELCGHSIKMRKARTAVPARLIIAAFLINALYSRIRREVI